MMEDRLSALHIAACKGQMGIAKLLINNKCNVNILTRFRIRYNYSQQQQQQTCASTFTNYCAMLNSIFSPVLPFLFLLTHTSPPFQSLPFPITSLLVSSA